MVTASATGLVRTVLIIIGLILLLRFIGQLMNAKRNMEEERVMLERQRKFEAEKKHTAQNLGKTRIIQDSPGAVQDVDFEEVE